MIQRAFFSHYFCICTSGPLTLSTCLFTTPPPPPKKKKKKKKIHPFSLSNLLIPQPLSLSKSFCHHLTLYTSFKRTQGVGWGGAGLEYTVFSYQQKALKSEGCMSYAWTWQEICTTTSSFQVFMNSSVISQFLRFYILAIQHYQKFKHHRSFT